MAERELNCNEMVELVTDYLEGSMPDADRMRFEAHLSTCEGCTNYLHQMRETIRITGRLTPDQIPPEQQDALRSAFRDWKNS
jgi:anti-sigma factor RsiW